MIEWGFRIAMVSMLVLIGVIIAAGMMANSFFGLLFIPWSGLALIILGLLFER